MSALRELAIFRLLIFTTSQKPLDLRNGSMDFPESVPKQSIRLEIHASKMARKLKLGIFQKLNMTEKTHQKQRFFQSFYFFSKSPILIFLKLYPCRFLMLLIVQRKFQENPWSGFGEPVVDFWGVLKTNIQEIARFQRTDMLPKFFTYIFEFSVLQTTISANFVQFEAFLTENEHF